MSTVLSVNDLFTIIKILYIEGTYVIMKTINIKLLNEGKIIEDQDLNDVCMVTVLRELAAQNDLSSFLLLWQYVKKNLDSLGYPDTLLHAKHITDEDIVKQIISFIFLMKKIDDKVEDDELNAFLEWNTDRRLANHLYDKYTKWNSRQTDRIIMFYGRLDINNTSTFCRWVEKIRKENKN